MIPRALIVEALGFLAKVADQKYGRYGERVVKALEADLRTSNRMVKKLQTALKRCAQYTDRLEQEVKQWKGEATKWRIEAKAAKEHPETPYG